MCAGLADPDQGLAALADLIDVQPSLAQGVDARDEGWIQVMALLGASMALGRWLRQRPNDVEVVLGDVSPWSAADIAADIQRRVQAVALDPVAACDELRWAYRRHLMRVAARDLTAPEPEQILARTCEELADLDDAVIQMAWVLARVMVPGADQVDLGVVALGKTGAREANYLSDVDVIFVAEPARSDGEALCSPQQAQRIGEQWAARITSICSAYTAAGSIWEVDANLRPEGASGPLVRTLAGMRTYYTTWAQNWEFQAMLKARPMAGDLDLAQGFVDLVSPLVWSAAEHEGFVSQAQAMRARVVSLIPASEANRDIKLSAGGLRDTEFSVQMLQLVHGRSDERLRVTPTLEALARLVAHGYVGRADGTQLDQAYRFQRLLEHRLQLFGLRRTHMMPTDERGLRRLARSVGLRDADQVGQAWSDSAKTVLRLHQRLYFSPLLEAVARIPTEEVRLTPQAAAVRLKALGYADPIAALRHIEALTKGMSRRAEILRQLLPALLGWMAAGPNPDAGLLAFRQMAEALGDTPFFMRALRDEGRMAQNLAAVLSSSRYAAALLATSPTSVAILRDADEARPVTGEELHTELTGAIGRYGPGQRAAEVIRGTRRRELLRLAVGEIVKDLDVHQVGRRLSELTQAVLDAALTVASAKVEDPPRLALIALGRWGGTEMSYASDADLMVVMADSDDPQATRKGTQILAEVRAMLKVPGPDPDLEIDVDLRPEGRDGPLVRTLSSCRAYYAKWAAPWEAQALIRARHGAGDEAVSDEFLADVAEVRYPLGGLSLGHLTQIRRLKARMESERIGRGVDPRDHVKLGPGGLSDVEWTVQTIQLNHGHDLPELRVTGTLMGLDQAERAGLIDAGDADGLRVSFVLASRIRNAITLVRNKASDLIPAVASDLSQVAHMMGYAKGEGSRLAEDWYRVARRAKAITDRLFWGDQN
jgi:glutamate-ammonia-ligase adenylyltransferase